MCNKDTKLKRALFLVNAASMIAHFNMSNIKLLLEQGYSVDVGCNFLHGNNCDDEKITQLKEELDKIGVKYYQIDFARTPFDLKLALGAYRQVADILKKNDYSLLHCHTPMGGFLGRIAAAKYRKKGLKIIYTAHGFHFYKGAPLINWLLYYPVEKICSYLTDILITINHEDFESAKRKMKAKKIEYIPGVGIDTKKFVSLPVEKRKELREKFGIKEDDILLISVGELNQNKNHSIIIKALSELKRKDIYFFIVGVGDLEYELKTSIRNCQLESQVQLLGYSSNIPQLYGMADICCFPSIREGLGLAALEGMSCGLALIASKNRGTLDYSVDGDNALLCEPTAVKDFAEAITKLADDPSLRRTMAIKNIDVAKHYDIETTNSIMKKIYIEIGS